MSPHYSEIACEEAILFPEDRYDESMEWSYLHGCLVKLGFDQA
jgi:hypothetical protein